MKKSRWCVFLLPAQFGLTRIQHLPLPSPPKKLLYQTIPLTTKINLRSAWMKQLMSMNNKSNKSTNKLRKNSKNKKRSASVHPLL